MGMDAQGGGKSPEWVQGDLAQSAAFEEAVSWAGFADRARSGKSLWAGNAALFAAGVVYGGLQGSDELALSLSAGCAGFSLSRMAWKALEQGAAKRLMGKSLAAVRAPLREVAKNVDRLAEEGTRGAFARAALEALRSGRGKPSGSDEDGPL